MKNLMKLTLIMSMALVALSFGACSDGGDDAECGNGQVETGETCDGNCPTACDDGDACTVDTLGGSADECTAICSFDAITACTDDDGCCPSGCTEADDNDCTGDPCEGVTECIDDDTCCPTNCDFTTDNDCTDPCEGVSECVAGDGCCPTGCDFSTDNDCDDPCEGVTECTDDDGCCPEGCDDSTDNDCEPDVCADVTECIDDDTCCPDGCDFTTDNDCADPCADVTECIADDGCCPEGCDAGTDNDCVDPCADITACDSGDGCCPDGCAFPDDLDCSFACDGIGDIRAAADDTPLDPAMVLCPAYVTYITTTGFYAQSDATGPAVYFYEGWDWNDDGNGVPLLAVGDRFTTNITEVTDYSGLKEVSAHDAFVVISQGFDVMDLVQDISAGTVPAEEHESELVTVLGAELTAMDGGDLTIAYGTATDVLLYASDVPIDMCVGATFDFLGPVSDYNGIQLRSHVVEDFSNINTDACADLGRAPVAGDLVLNEILYDPASGADANCDESADTADDEFVEIVNGSGEDLDLSGVTIADGNSVRHTFVAFGLPAGGVVVVFGGGSADCAWETNVQAITAGEGALGLNNNGDTITIATADGSELVTLTYENLGNIDQSITLSPDLDTAAGYEQHTVADTADASPFSPGTAIDGTALAP